MLCRLRAAAICRQQRPSTYLRCLSFRAGLPLLGSPLSCVASRRAIHLLDASRAVISALRIDGRPYRMPRFATLRCMRHHFWRHEVAGCELRIRGCPLCHWSPACKACTCFHPASGSSTVSTSPWRIFSQFSLALTMRENVLDANQNCVEFWVQIDALRVRYDQSEVE